MSGEGLMLRRLIAGVRPVERDRPALGMGARLWAIAVTTTLMGALDAYWIFGSHHQSLRGLVWSLGALVTYSFIGTGMYAWWRRPDSRIGLLLIGVGFVFEISGASASDQAGWFTLGILFNSLPFAMLAHVIISYPSGRVEGVHEKALIAFAYFLTLFGMLPELLLGDHQALDCARCPESAIRVASQQQLYDTANIVIQTLAVVLLLDLAWVVIRRWRRGTAPQRRAGAAVTWSGVICLLAIAAAQVVQVSDAPETVQAVAGAAIALSFVSVPYAFLGGLMRSRWTRAVSVGGLLSGLGQTRGRDRLRDLLVDALGDRSLALAYWLPDRGHYVDVTGSEVTLPRDVPGRAFTPVELDGRPVGAIVHDASLDEDPDLVRSVGAAAALAMENERLQAELRARVDELQRSRARLVEVGMGERRRLERNLHDGAQQRLVALSLQLRMAQNAVGKSPEQAAELIESAREELATALDELRELARGIHPAVLSDRGLGPALDLIAHRSPVPVQIESVPEPRLPPAVEAAAYYVVTEALTNVARYAQASEATVTVVREPGFARIEVKDDGVGGADPANGTGLRGLADRLNALDGKINVQSPAGHGTVLRAEIPCAS